MKSALIIAIAISGQIAANTITIPGPNIISEYKLEKRATAAYLDKKKAIFGCKDGSIIVYDYLGNRQTKVLKSTSPAVNSVAICSNGKNAITWVQRLNLDWGERINTKDDNDWDKTAELWDIESGTVIKRLDEHFRDIYSVAFSGNCKYALTGAGNGNVSYLDLEAGTELASTQNTLSVQKGNRWGIVQTVVMSSDGKWGAAAIDDIVRVYDLTKRVSIGHDHMWDRDDSRVQTLAIRGDGQRVFLARDGRIQEETSERDFTWKKYYSGRGSNIVLAQNEQKALVEHEGSVFWRDLISGADLLQLPPRKGLITAIAVDAEGEAAVVASGNGNILIFATK